MDNAMVKRGIGAIVLAIIAALLLGWLLKDKSDQRQEVVDMSIPSLTDSSATDATTPSLLDESKSLISNTVNSVNDTGAAVIASASSVTSNSIDKIKDTTGASLEPIKDTVSESIQNPSSMKPGFAIRPPQNNEEKQIVDNTQIPTQEKNVVSKQLTQDNNSANTNDTVIASTANTTAKTAKKVFKPQIVEKKKAKKKVTSQPKKSAKTTTATNIPTTAFGKYSIQLLATSSQSRANKLAKTMKGEGYQVFVTETTRNDKVLFRVRVGGHTNRGSALKAQEGMKKRYLKNFFVQNSLVISN